MLFNNNYIIMLWTILVEEELSKYSIKINQKCAEKRTRFFPHYTIASAYINFQIIITNAKGNLFMKETKTAQPQNFP